MYNLLTLIITVFALLLYLGWDAKRRDKIEKERFREFVLAIKSKDVQEYVEVIPNDAPLPSQEEDDIVDLDQVDPTTLLKAIRNEGNKN